MRTIVGVVSLATCAVSVWMCAMYFVLRHPGYQARAAVAAAICVGAATLLGGRPLAPLRIPVGVWGVALAVFGVWALRSPGDDGWAVIAAALFVVEGVLAVTSAARPA